LSHSTAPSFATRITAVGKAYDHVERRQGRNNSFYGFRFVPENGNPVNIETDIILPDWDTPADFDGRTFRIVYLEDSNRFLKNKAIDIAILSGKHAGFHDSLDADPAGPWLGIPVGAALVGFGMLGFRYMKKDAAIRASSLPHLPTICTWAWCTPTSFNSPSTATSSAAQPVREL
jgi:hypothetical protein